MERKLDKRSVAYAPTGSSQNCVRSIAIITSPFGCIPPNAIGAVEKLWKSCGDIYLQQGLQVTFLCKKPKANAQLDPEHCVYIQGYERTGSWLKDFVLDFVYSCKALYHAPKSDALVVNTLWSPVLLPFVRRKYKVSLFAVQRFPKKQFGWYKPVDILSCVSTPVYHSLISQTPSATNKACMISNFITTDIYRVRKKHEIQGTPCIVYSGRVHREKGLELLVKAVSLISKNQKIDLKIIGAWQTAMAGSGADYRDELNRLAQGYTIDWVDPIFDPEQLAQEIDKGDIYCYPSKADKGETFGVAPLEAMALGVPTIVSGLDCFKDFVQDGENGLVFDHHVETAVADLAKLIQRLIAEPDLYQRLSDQGALSAKKFSAEAISEQYLTVLNNMLFAHQTGFNPQTMKVERKQLNNNDLCAAHRGG
jgi:glycosyltransferase involved in cell wall biosynthesis